jgi:hypothetical protein
MLNSEASAGVDSYGGRPRWGHFAKYARGDGASLLSPSTIGFPFYFGKKKSVPKNCHCEKFIKP